MVPTIIASTPNICPHRPKTAETMSREVSKHEMTIAKRELMFSRLDFSNSQFAT